MYRYEAATLKTKKFYIFKRKMNTFFYAKISDDTLDQYFKIPVH